MKTAFLPAFAFLPFLAACHSAAPNDAATKPLPVLADEWRYTGVALNEPGYDVWCCSPLRGPDGRIHLYVSRWPSTIRFDKGWRTASEIAHYVGERPEGPFKFVSVIGKGAPSGWNKRGYHNPAITVIDGKYVLTFIANDGSEPHSPSQRIGMMIADSPDGPWRELPAPVISPPEDPAIWCHASGSGVANPALIKYGNRYHLYFKARIGPKGPMTMGLAVAEKLEGPYVIRPNPIMANTNTVEDGFVFFWRGRLCLLTTDNHGILENGGGLLWTSDNGYEFDPKPAPGFHHFGNHYLKGVPPPNANYRYTRQIKVERPQLLLDATGEPEWLYAPCGVALDGGDGTDALLFHRDAHAADAGKTR